MLLCVHEVLSKCHSTVCTRSSDPFYIGYIHKDKCILVPVVGSQEKVWLFFLMHYLFMHWFHTTLHIHTFQTKALSTGWPRSCRKSIIYLISCTCWSLNFLYSPSVKVLLSSKKKFHFKRTYYDYTSWIEIETKTFQCNWQFSEVSENAKRKICPAQAI